MKKKPEEPQVPKVTAGQARMVAQVKAARACSVPIIAINTMDQAATIQAIMSNLNGTTNNSDPPKLVWDVCTGLAAKNEPGLKFIAALGEEKLGEMKHNPVAVLETMPALPGGGILFYLNAQRWLADPVVVQAIWNLRDQFKDSQRMLILLGPTIEVPLEIQGDVISIDEPLPQGEELAAIVREAHSYAEINPSAEVVDRAVEAVQGLHAFQAEQVLAMSMDLSKAKTGLNMDTLWESKRRMIEQTPGLSVSREGVTFDDIGGLHVIKEYLRALCRGNDRPCAITFVDEIEKSMAGAAGDMSGTSQDQLGTLLSEMQDYHAIGVILVGVPGSGKSIIAKATGNDAGIPTVRLDLGACRGSLVGESEAKVRSALKTIRTISNGRSMWVATCNSLASLPPELRRRFKCGLWFFDTPSSEERAAIWEVHRLKWKIPADDPGVIDDDGWTGAEIEQCAELAWRLNKPLAYAADFVVPISKSAPDRVEALRAQADGRWLNASERGVYRKPGSVAAPLKVVAKQGRKLAME